LLFAPSFDWLTYLPPREPAILGDAWLKGLGK
jgi:hypothetical protein